MLEHTKTHRIDVTLTFTGPAEMRRRAIELMQSIGFMDTDEAIPWEQAFPEYSNNVGAILRGARGKEGITQKQLSEKTGIPQRHISEMENNKRPIGKQTAKLFAKALNIDYRVFL